MKQLELFPEKQIIVSLYFAVLNNSINLTVEGPGLEIDSFWSLREHITDCFPSLTESVAMLGSTGSLSRIVELSEKEWKYWSALYRWPWGTYFYWDV